MTKKAQTKTPKQRSTKSRSLSSSAPKTPAARKVRKPRKPAVVTKKLINFPLGRGAHLALTINRPKKSVKKRPVTRKNKKTTKKQDTLITLALLLVGLAGTVGFGLRAFAAPAPSLLAPQPVTVASKVPAPAAPENPSLPRSVPTKIRIPDIQLDAELATVGLLSNGTLDVPTDYTKAGWYEGSPTPGEIGPSIIDGHLDHIGGVAVFWRLRELVPGQVIAIDREDGTTAHFVVDEVKQFPQDNFPTAEVYGNTSNSSLRLITCGGTFNRLTQHYDRNTIIFASLKK
jgi:sortase (surface protein transpeptidase)